MDTPLDVNFNERLNRLKSQYDLSRHDRDLLKSIEDCHVVSIAYTANGGFDRKTGAYYAEERGVNYKLRIRYRKPAGRGERFLLLMPDRVQGT